MKQTNKQRRNGIIYLTAYQTLLGYLMPKFDLFIYVITINIFNVPLQSFNYQLIFA